MSPKGEAGPQLERHNTHLRGIAAMLGAVFVFSCMDALLKFFAQFYPPMQVTAMRGIASLPFVVVPLLFSGRLHEIRPTRYHMHLLRGVLSLVIMAGFVYSVRVLSLADAYAIFLSAPLIVTALSVPLLGERVGWRRWAAICTGLVGVLAMLRPSASSLVTLGALAAFASAVCYAVNAITLRVLTRTDTTTSVVFWTMALMTLLSSAFAARDWQPIRAEHLGWLAALGLVGALGVRLLTEAFRSAPASVIAPFEYTALLWGVALDWVIWDALPGARVYVGGGIVIASGLYIIWRERRANLVELNRAAGGSSATAG